MSDDHIAATRALIDQLQGKTTGTLIPASKPAPPATVSDWKTAYAGALKSWKTVIADGGHDHTPMPTGDMITSLQVGLIEKPNKPDPKRKPKTPPYTHKLCVEVWTVPHGQIVRHKKNTQWRRFAQLRLEAGFEKTIKEATKAGHLSTGFRDWALGVVGREGKPGDLWGIYHDINGGWTYYDEHLIRVDTADKGWPIVHLWRDRAHLVALELSTEFAGANLPDGSTQTHITRQDIEQEEA